MNWAHWLVLLTFTFGHLGLTLHNRTLRHPAPKSRREQIARIKATQQRF